MYSQVFDFLCAILKGIVFLYSFSNISLLVYRNATDLCFLYMRLPMVLNVMRMISVLAVSEPIFSYWNTANVAGLSLLKDEWGVCIMREGFGRPVQQCIVPPLEHAAGQVSISCLWAPGLGASSIL